MAAEPLARSLRKTGGDNKPEEFVKKTCIYLFDYPYYYLKMIFSSEYQFFYPVPKESELIASAPFRGGVFRDNRFAYWVHKRIFILSFIIFDKN